MSWHTVLSKDIIIFFFCLMSWHTVVSEDLFIYIFLFKVVTHNGIQRRSIFFLFIVVTRDDVLRRANPLLTENKQLYLTTIYRSYFFGGFDFFQWTILLLLFLVDSGDLSFLTLFRPPHDRVHRRRRWNFQTIALLTVVVVGPHCS